MKNSRLYLALTLMIWISLAPACSNTLIPTPTLQLSTLSPTIEITLPPRVTPTPIASVTNTPTPSFTPIPTLPLSEARSMVFSMYETNSECKFPCWWGIEPGESSWSTTRNFLASFSEQISPPSTHDFYGVAKGYSIYFPIDTESGNPLSLRIVEQDDLIKFISGGVYKELEYANNSKKYFLHALLAEYGAPDQIYLYTQPYTPENLSPFSILLFYKQQRFAFIYYEFGILQNNHVRGCFENDFSFISWAPNTISELADLTKAGMSREDFGQYRPLNEVTQLNMNTFYESFKDPATPFCIETPIEIWP